MQLEALTLTLTVTLTLTQAIFWQMQLEVLEGQLRIAKQELAASRDPP